MTFISSNFRDEIVYIEDLIQVVISYISYKNIPVFSEKTDVPHLPNQSIVAISAVTLKIRSRSTNSNKLLILSDLYRLANLVTFHPIVHEITCRQTLIGLILVD